MTLLDLLCLLSTYRMAFSENVKGDKHLISLPYINKYSEAELVTRGLIGRIVNIPINTGHHTETTCNIFTNKCGYNKNPRPRFESTLRAYYLSTQRH